MTTRTEGQAGEGPRAPPAVLAGAALLVASVFAAYGRTFSAPFVFDDIPSIVDNPSLRHLATGLWPPTGSTTVGRPLLNFSLAANYAVSGLSPWSYRAANVAFLACAGLALFGIVRRTLAPRCLGATRAALCVALLWALHPLLTESVTFVIQRAESLMGLFYLLTVYGLVRGAGAEGPAARGWYALCVGACLLGMATKETMATAPLVALLFDRAFLAGSIRAALRLRGPVYAGLAATWLVVAALAASTQGRNGTSGFGAGMSAGAYALTQVPAVVHYLRLCAWPHPLVFDYGTALTPLSWVFLPSALVLAGLLAASAWALARGTGAGFLGASFFILLAPSSSVIPLATDPIAEHRMFLPLIPVAALAVAALHRGLGRAAAPVCMALAACLLGATWMRNEAYRTEEALWSATVRDRPGNERARNNLGNALEAMPGRLDDAIAQYEEAIRLVPDYVEAHFNLGKALYAAGRGPEAISQLEETLRLRPDHVKARYCLGLALEHAPGRLDEAVGQFEEALRLRPDFAEAHLELGGALQASPGRMAEALEQYRQAVRLRPADADAHFALGSALASTPGAPDEAIAQLGAALQLRPGFAEAHGTLGYALMRAPGRSGEAIAQYEEALRLKPDFTEARCNLGNALALAGRATEAIAQYRQALRERPDDATLHYNLAAALLGTPGGDEEAVAHLREAVRLEPGYEAARLALGRLAPR